MSRKKLARRLARLYYASLMAASSRTFIRHKRHQISLEELTQNDRRAFLKAADTVVSIGAQPKDYIVAQFQAFAAYTKHTGRYLLPKTNQLWSMQAIYRYQQYMGQREMTEARRAPTANMQRSFFRDERKLAGLVRHTRQLPEDVLTTYPEEFSKEFLRARGLWPLVAKEWHARSNG